MIYLASSSPRRKALLKEHGIRFKAVKPRYHERLIARISPRRLVQIHALEKGKSCVSPIGEGIILSADTIVYFKKKIIGKPKDRRHAIRILSELQGRWHEVFSGVAVLQVKNSKILKKKVFAVKTRIKIRPMTRKEILGYFRRVNPLDKAGAYAIQSKSISIVQRVQGSFSNAMGLPMERLLIFLDRIMDV